MPLNQWISRIAGVVAVACFAQIASAQVMTCETPLRAYQRGKVKFVPGHYVAIGSGDAVATRFTTTLAEISDPDLDDKIVGVQKRYYWSDLNPWLNIYRLKQLQDDIREAKAAGKRLSVMIMFKFSDDGGDSAVPLQIKNLKADTAKIPGVTVQPFYQVNTDEGENSEVANFGHPVVRDRFILFMSRLAQEVDGSDTVTSIVFPESAMGITTAKAPYKGVMSETELNKLKDAHAEGLRYIDQVAGCLFKHTPVIPLTNYPPKALDAFYDTFERFNLGLGGPDIWTDDTAIEISYDFVRNLNNQLPVGFIVAGGNYKYVSRKGEEAAIDNNAATDPVTWTHQYRNHWTDAEKYRLTIHALLNKAQTLGSNFLFWKKNGDTGDRYWDALKSEIAAGRIPDLDKTCPRQYTWASGMGAGCVENLP